MKTTRFFVLIGALALLASLAGAASAGPVYEATDDGCPAGSDYDARCDVTHDGGIDVLDVQRVAGRWSSSGTWTIDPHTHWGQTWTGSGTGLTLSGGSVGLSGQGTTYGIVGRSAAGRAVYGEATGTTGVNYGVYGQTHSVSGSGVIGENLGAGGNGVYGVSPSGHGVHGKANPPDGFGVYSEGNAYVDGELFWDPLTSYVSIPTSAFIPQSYDTNSYVDYENEGHRLKNQSARGEWYTAPVQVPHLAIVTELNVCWKDWSDESATLSLRRRSLASVASPVETMAQVESVGSASTGRQGCWSDTTIDSAAINNQNYAYFLEVSMPPSSQDLELYGVSIAYQVSRPY